MGPGSEGGMQGYIIRGAQERVPINRSYSAGFDNLIVQLGVVDDSLKPQPPALGGGSSPNPAKTNHTQGLVLQALNRADHASIPKALAGQVKQGRQAPGLGQQQRNGVGRDLIN